MCSVVCFWMGLEEVSLGRFFISGGFFGILHEKMIIKGTQHARGGFALVAVIWTVAVLSLLVCSFAMDAYMEGKSAVYIGNRHQATALVDSGLVLAEMLMERQDGVSEEATKEDAEEDRWIVPAIRLKRGQRVEIHQRLYADEQGHLQFAEDSVEEGVGDPPDAEIFVAIEPEPARWNINKMTHAGMGEKEADELWARILLWAGVPEEDWDELVDSFYDWVDEDDNEESEYGAEEDYYQGLEPSYHCKNGPLDTVGELAYIRGFNRNGGVLLKGGVWNPDEERARQITVKGIEHLFTTYGTGKINVNAAPREVLLTVPCLVEDPMEEVETWDTLTVDAIIEEREGLNAGTADASERVAQEYSLAEDKAVADYHFKDMSDFLARISGLTQEEVNPYLTVDCDVYRLELEGRVGNVRRRVWAVVQRGASGSDSAASTGSGKTSAGIGGNGLVILQWREET